MCIKFGADRFGFAGVISKRLIFRTTEVRTVLNNLVSKILLRYSRYHDFRVWTFYCLTLAESQDDSISCCAFRLVGYVYYCILQMHIFRGKTGDNVRLLFQVQTLKTAGKSVNVNSYGLAGPKPARNLLETYSLGGLRLRLLACVVVSLCPNSTMLASPKTCSCVASLACMNPIDLTSGV